MAEAPTTNASRWPAAAALVAANLVPLYGVLAWGWPAFPVIALFWIEAVLVGATTLLRILCARPASLGSWMSKVLVAPFFLVHYGFAMAVYAALLAAVFDLESYHRLMHGLMGVSSVATSKVNDFPLILGSGLLGAGLLLLDQVGSGWAGALSIAALGASHLFSFLRNYIGRGEYRHADPIVLNARPYWRVMLLHLVVVPAGVAAHAAESPLWAIVTLVAVKTAIDLAVHLREHRVRPATA